MNTHSPALAAPFGTSPSAPADAAVPRMLRLPGIEQPMRHRALHTAMMLRNLAGGHRLRAPVPGRPGTYQAQVDVGEALRLRWHRLFATAVDRPLPYQTNQSVGTLLYSRVFADLGINYRHLVHVRHEAVHDAGTAALAAASRMLLTTGLHRLLRMGENRALVELRTLVQGADGALLSTVQDAFLVRELPPADLAQVPADRTAMRDLLGLRRRQPQIALNARGVRTCWVPVADDLGHRFAQVSGDFNPVHTTRWGARLFGHRQPFLQGLGLRSLLLGPLAAMGLSLDRLQMTFAAPAVLGQPLALVVQDDSFEVRDTRGQLVAFGTAGGLDDVATAAATGAPATTPVDVSDDAMACAA